MTALFLISIALGFIGAIAYILLDNIFGGFRD
jgi:hypothetical protein